jgi:hypothetical protein
VDEHSGGTGTDPVAPCFILLSWHFPGRPAGNFVGRFGPLLGHIVGTSLMRLRHVSATYILDRDGSEIS